MDEFVLEEETGDQAVFVQKPESNEKIKKE